LLYSIILISHHDHTDTLQFQQALQHSRLIQEIDLQPVRYPTFRFILLKHCPDSISSMFGESDSESPRVPSPWDSLVSTPASYSPSPSPLAVARSATPSPAQLAPVLGPTLPSSPLTYPKLIPESDDGNIEYKLHLLSPSPARFARLVTQMKWRLLEGGGQAYYELGVSDSGLLVGMSHADLERSLETLEMMAGEIGASVIVVKEIEVPEKLVEMVNSGEVKEVDHRRVAKKEEDGFMFMLASEDETTTTEDDEEDESEDTGHGDGVFDMDPVEPQQQFSIDIEIASVFKPRPVRTKLSAGTGLPNSGTSSGNSSSGRDYKRNKKREKKEQKVKRDAFNGHAEDPPQKLSRREIRDRRREGKNSALQNLVQESLDANAENVSEIISLTTPLIHYIY